MNNKKKTKQIMEQKKAKIELYVNDEGKVVSIIQGKGLDLLGMMMAAMAENRIFRALSMKAAELLLQTMEQKKTSKIETKTNQTTKTETSWKTTQKQASNSS